MNNTIVKEWATGAKQPKVRPTLTARWLPGSRDAPKLAKTVSTIYSNGWWSLLDSDNVIVQKQHTMDNINSFMGCCFSALYGIGTRWYAHLHFHGHHIVYSWMY